MLPILYQNDDIIAVDKPPGLASIPERDKTKESVLAQLSRVYPHKIYVVHRLDKNASGVLLFAKNARTHKYLSRQFASRTVKKTYLALVQGVVAEDRGVIDKPLRQFASGRVAVDTAGGKPSATEFEVVQRLDSYTLVRAYPLTGRLHQLRVHFYSIGHPIVGDRVYGDKEIQPHVKRRAKYGIYLAPGFTGGFERLMLHAERITFQLPSGTEIMVESPPPDSFLQTVLTLRKRERST